MKCPFCGYENISGEDECDKCGEDLTAFDGVRPHSKLERSIVKDTLEFLHCSPPLFVDPTTSVHEVAKLLAQGNQSVLVMDQHQLVGIVTERDILFKAMGVPQDLANTPASDIMTPNPETLESTDKIAYALHKMAIGGFRQIPMFKDGKTEGVVSVRDILAYLAEMFPDAVGIHE